MSDAPERIWAHIKYYAFSLKPYHNDIPYLNDLDIEYVRADLVEELERSRDAWKNIYEMADKRVNKLEAENKELRANIASAELARIEKNECDWKRRREQRRIIEALEIENSRLKGIIWNRINKT